MYDHLVGEIVEKQPSRVIVRCGGVGFECRASLTTTSLLRAGAVQTVFTILHVVEGAPSLIGFATTAERDIARRLLSVSSVGPSIALALLSMLSPAELMAAIARGDVPALRRVKGIGQKIAERLCLELRDSMQKLDLASSRTGTPAIADQSATDAVAALVTLGYGEKEAREKVERVQRREDVPPTSTEGLVKAVLQM
jgi:Holliday junction DNA helicase RuvA